jgi:hypothetical protein
MMRPSRRIRQGRRQPIEVVHGELEGVEDQEDVVEEVVDVVAVVEEAFNRFWNGKVSAYFCILRLMTKG